MLSMNNPAIEKSLINMSATNTNPSPLCEEEHILLRELAKNALQYGLQHAAVLPLETARYPRLLREPGASFVTLKKHGKLRGCMGSLTARRALAEDVAHNAYAAAFSDPRFSPLTEAEFVKLDFHLSVLTPAVPMSFRSETDLLRQLQPGIDGLVLEDGAHRGTFLPSVWESLPEAQQFLQHLKQKAGLPAHYWSDTLKISRYSTDSF